MAVTMAAPNMLPNNSMNFTENQHGNAILETLRGQREQRHFCDVVLHVQGQQFEAHRCVLAACSTYFQAMFKQERVVKEQLTISCGGHEIFRCLLDYVYTGNVVIDKHNVSELVRLANHFNVLKLRAHCAEYLERYLDVTNCLSVMDMAEKYQMTQLLRTAVAFVRVNIDEVLLQQEAMELPQNKVEQLIMDKDLNLAPERQLRFILDWVRHSVASRENELRQLLVSAQLQLVERGRLLQLVQTHRLLAESERCLYFTLQSLADAGVRLPAYEQLFSQMEEKYMQDLVVDNDTFLSMAISTAIEELEGTEATIFDGLHRLQQQAAVSSSQNPPPIETFSISALDEETAAGGGAVAEADGGVQETARDLRCHNPAAAGRYPAPLRYAVPEYQPAPEPHDKYPDPAGGEARYDAALADPRAAPRPAPRYRSTGDCHEVAGLYGAALPAPGGEAQYMMVMKRLEKPEDDGPLPAEPGAERRLLDQPYLLYSEYQEVAGGGGAYCGDAGPLTPCRFEPRRHAELAATDALYAGHPAQEPRLRPGAGYEPAADARQPACYLTVDGRLEARVQYEPQYVCEAAALEPLVGAACGEPAAAALCAAQDARRMEPGPQPRAELVDQDRFGLEQKRFEVAEQARFEVNEEPRFGQADQARFAQVEQARFEQAEQARFEQAEQARFEQEEQARLDLEQGRLGRLEQAQFEQMDQARFEQTEEGRLQEAAQERLEPTPDPARFAQTDQGKFVKMELAPMGAECFEPAGHQGRFSQQEHVRFQPAEPTPFPQQPEHSRLAEPGQALVEEQLQFEPQPPLAAMPPPPPPPPPPLPMPAKKRKLDPGLAEELRTEELRAEELRTEELRTEELRMEEPRAEEQRTSEEARPSAAEPAPEVQVTVNMSPKKKRLRLAPEQSAPTQAARIDSTEADLAPLLVVDPPPRSRHYVCPRCPAVFSVRSALEKHQSEKHRDEQLKKTFICDLCQTSCDKMGLYMEHMRTHFEGPPFTCNVCFREMHVFVKFMRHRREHGENKPHRCPDCNFSFWKKCNLTQHMRIHTGEKPYKCDLCGAAFTLSTTLKQHRSSHSTVKAYFCDECDFSTKYANHLVSHKKIHAGDLHRCQHAGCTYTTPKRSHLREHLQAHAKRRTHCCPHCHRAFNVKTHLSRHLRTHDLSKQYRCHLCPYSVYRSDRLKSHLKTHARALVPKGRKPKAKKQAPEAAEEGEAPPQPAPPPPQQPQQPQPSLPADWGVF